MTKNRLEAFSDGVVAIAITLLVIELHSPDGGDVAEHGSLAGALALLWPSYLAYLVSFAVIGVMWLNHHRLFEQVQRVDGPLLLLNLFLLLWLVVLPFPTSVVAEHLRNGGEPARTALAVYGAVSFMNAVAFTLLLAWITHDARLTGKGLPPPVRRAARRRFGLGLGVYAVAFALSWVSPPLALALHGATALYYAFDQATVAGDERQLAEASGA